MPDTVVRPDSIGISADVLFRLRLLVDRRRPGRCLGPRSGELDVAAVPQLERTLGTDGLQARLVVLDLRELALVDGSGVHAIVSASRGARQARRRLVLLRGPPNVDRLFTLTGSSGDLEIGDLDPGDPAAQVLQLAREDLGS